MAGGEGGAGEGRRREARAPGPGPQRPGSQGPWGRVGEGTRRPAHEGLAHEGQRGDMGPAHEGPEGGGGTRARSTRARPKGPSEPPRSRPAGGPTHRAPGGPQGPGQAWQRASSQTTRGGERVGRQIRKSQPASLARVSLLFAFPRGKLCRRSQAKAPEAFTVHTILCDY